VSAEAEPKTGALDAWTVTSDVQGILKGLRVLGLSRVLAGPYCTQVLSDYVINVEAPAGDETRSWGPPFNPDGTSAYHHGLNRNKGNLCLDLSTSAGREVVALLIAQADVVVENLKTTAPLGLGYEEVLAARHPRLVYCRISGFGTDGPMSGLPGYDAVLQAYGGLMSVNGYPDRKPLRLGVPIVDLLAANLAFSGVLFALHERHASGFGQLIDPAPRRRDLHTPHPPGELSRRRTRRPAQRRHAPEVAPYQVLTPDQARSSSARPRTTSFRMLMTVLGKPELADDPRFVDNATRITHVTWPLCCPQWSRNGTAARWPGSPSPRKSRQVRSMNDVGTALREPQVAHRGLFVDVPGCRWTDLLQPLSHSRTRRAPRLGRRHLSRTRRAGLRRGRADPSEIRRRLRA
jgi:crotonobetainyl-CoA:carnitine CoA-transferase CaiB-like acyl-CoA transferase